MSFDIQAVRNNFPSLQSGAVFLDNPGGTQVSQLVIDAMKGYFLNANANQGGAFATSERNDEMVQEARRAFADFLNASSPSEIVFGHNMTTLTYHVSRALGRTLSPGDEIVVTRLDHDANISPWLALQERGAKVHWVDFHPEDCTLDMADFAEKLSTKTRIVAVGLASNAVGTINPVRAIAALAHGAGALVYVDAVHYVPHFPVDVQALDCDFLACSAYKFYGPHIGVLYGRYDLLDNMEAYRVRPSSPLPPSKYETGTQNFEGIAGSLAAVHYLASIGARYGAGFVPEYPAFSGRKLDLKTGMKVVCEYERTLFSQLLQGLQRIRGLKVLGMREDPPYMPPGADSGPAGRAPTVAFNLQGLHPRAVAESLAASGIYAWDGNYYALEVMSRLGLEENGGAVRAGLAHYNTAQEVEALLEALRKIRA